VASPWTLRELRLARLPLLLAYLLVLLGTPVGEAGFLWMHLTTAHSTPATPHAEPERRGGVQSGAAAALASAPGHENATPPAREHEHAPTHAHRHSAAHASASEHAHPSAYEDELAAPPTHEHAAHEHDSGHGAAYEHTAAREDTAEHAHPHLATREHRRIASAGSQAEDRSFALDEPHEHGGRVHTHQQHPVPDAALLIDALSKFYLSPPTTPAPSPSAGNHHASQILPALQQVAARIDTPPPRLPG
jgi:hypothetical protein